MSITIEKKPRCRFDMFTRRKKNSIEPVKNAKEEFTYRGDKYSTDPSKMLKLLVGMVKNYHRQYVVMELYDNTKPKGDPDRIILKMLNGIPKINRLPDYAELIIDYPLPEYLSYEMKD
jgi:hypothetical protein